ncbi:hypothetical protein D3C79_950440 [compost metagenome]
MPSLKSNPLFISVIVSPDLTAYDILSIFSSLCSSICFGSNATKSFLPIPFWVLVYFVIKSPSLGGQCSRDIKRIVTLIFSTASLLERNA